MKKAPAISRRTKIKHRWGILFSTPAMIFIAAFMLLPIICVFVLAFTSWDGITDISFIGFENFTNIFKDKEFVTSILNNFKFMLYGVPIWTITPLVIAALLYEEIKGFSLFRTAFLFPTVLSASIIGIIFKTLFSMRGPINTMLKAAGLDFLALDWLATGNTAIPLIVSIINWAGFGSAVLIFLSAMSSIDNALYESAMIDGAGWWKRFFKITLPVIQNVIFFVIILNVIASFTSLFNYIFVMTNGGPGYETSVMEFLIYTKAFRSNQMGYACALAVIMFIIIAILTAIFLMIQRKSDKMHD